MLIKKRKINDFGKFHPSLDVCQCQKKTPGGISEPMQIPFHTCAAGFHLRLNKSG